MKYARAVGLAVLGVVLVMYIPGCGLGGSDGAVYSKEQLSIEQLAQIFRAYKKGEKTPPKGLKDFLKLERGFPAAIGSIRKGDVMVFWGVDLSEGPRLPARSWPIGRKFPRKGAKY